MSNGAIRLTIETVRELQTVMSDNGRYWSGEMRKYLARGMTPDQKLRERKPAARISPER